MARRRSPARTSSSCSRPLPSPVAQRLSRRRPRPLRPTPASSISTTTCSIPETREVLSAVDARGLRQIVLSNHVWELPEICVELGLLPPIAEVLTSARLSVEKPHPETYAAAIAAAGCAAHEILFVGDTYEADVAGPERAGMQALLVRRPHPDARNYADDLTGVLDLVLRPETTMARVVGLEDIKRARTVIDGVVTPTPVLSAGAISRWTGTRVLLKAENLQRTGAFKLRGATNRMSTLSDEERARGVVAASAGNHAQGVALAATALGVSSRVYMPVDAPLAKQVATADYGAEVVLAGETFEESFAAARADPEGRVLVPPFDDEAIIAGQGTIGLELLEQVPEADVDRRAPRRRRAALGHRDRDQGPAPRHPRDRRAGLGLRGLGPVARGRPSRRDRARHDDRRRHRRAAPGRHHVPARPAVRRRGRRGDRGRDLPRRRGAAGALEADGGRRGRSRSRGAAGGQDHGARGRLRALGRQPRRGHAADHRALRPDPQRPLPAPAHADARPARVRSSG